MANLIPEGYELLSGRGRDNAREAIRLAEERGFSSESVLSQTDGFLVPLGDSEAFDVDTANVEALNDHIDAKGLDVDKSLNKADKIAAIKAASATGSKGA
jgi:hypothetical protein